VPDSHPIRAHRVNVWQAPAGQGSPRWIALFGDGEAFPIRFSGETESDVRARAEAFRADVIAKNEAAFIARQEAVEKARATRKAKDATA
jgi:hypothetical protein